ncbi:hypothetical protein BH18VER1_BH18VER1_08820 [soil metagenome]
MPREEFTFEQPRSVFTTWLGIVLLFAFFGLLVWTVMGMMSRSDEYEKKRAEARVEKLKTSREAWSKETGYGWADKEKGVVHIPVQRAMELAMVELAQKKPGPANPIPPEPGSPGQQATAPMTPAAPPVLPAGAQPSEQPPATSIKGEDSEIGGQPAAAANPPAAQPGTQPGPSSTPAASPPAGTNQPHPGAGQPTAPPAQVPAGSPIPVPGATP